MTYSKEGRAKQKKLISPQADMIEVLTFFEKALDKNDWTQGLTKSMTFNKKEKMDISEGYSSEFEKQSSSNTDISSLQRETFGAQLIQN